MAYTLDCRVSVTPASPATAVPDDAFLPYTHYFTLNTRWPGRIVGGAVLVFVVLAMPWRAVGRGARAALVGTIFAVAVAGVVAWDIARAVAGPGAAAAWRRRFREHAIAGRSTLVRVFRHVVLATAALVLINAVVWVLGWVTGWLFGLDGTAPSSDPTMMDYDEMVRTSNAWWEPSIADWTWANGYVTRPR